ncbi:hypothetical protein CLV78_1113 [Aliiruegeria haliotis]|uniref:Uncharacterized protein n=1 Tax=Aliiruegeria haliotis TaxID=1280846 RepID=A0A2T0RIC7_9RHOB|nr:hypothetical protein [Aliiruegeria haliotis]PRY20850.1 hypothetical protein CLV78_1113 [Aliiruegeria haliotis]
MTDRVVIKKLGKGEGSHFRYRVTWTENWGEETTEFECEDDQFRVMDEASRAMDEVEPPPEAFASISIRFHTPDGVKIVRGDDLMKHLNDDDG